MDKLRKSLFATRTVQIDKIQKITGEFGRYQLWICFLVFLSKVPQAFNQIAIIFLAPKVSYTCPSTNKETCPCPNPVYDKSIFTNTIIMRWDLICEKKWLAHTHQMMFQSGTLFGSLGFGVISDRYGRKLPFAVAMLMQIVGSISVAFIPEFWTFNIIRFIVGLSIGGNMVIGFVIIMEFVGTRYRDMIAALYQLPFNFGHMLLPLISYCLRDYVDFLLAISLPAIILILYFCLIPETPRWLIAMKRTNEAIILLEKVAKINKRPTENIRSDVEEFQLALEKNKLKKGTMIDLFRTPNIRKNIIAMAYNWFTCSYCFYGVSQYASHLSGNIFINVFAGATFSALGTIASIPLLKVMGRKTNLILFNGICALCLIILTISPQSTISIVCAIIGQVSAFIIFVIVYLYCSEMFPTVVRNAALGFSSMCARIGSMIAPFIIGLKDTARWLPPLLFALAPLFGFFVTFLLPETQGCELMTTIEEGERFGKKVNNPAPTLEGDSPSPKTTTSPQR